MAIDNKLLGEFDLMGIPPAPRGIPQIEVTFDIDANGLVNVNARDKATAKEMSITVQSSGGLSKEEVEKMVEQAEQMKADDEKRRKAIELKNDGDSLIYNTEKNLREYDDKLDQELKDKTQQCIVELRTAMENDDADAMQSKSDELRELTSEIGKTIYSQASQ